MFGVFDGKVVPVNVVWMQGMGGYGERKCMTVCHVRRVD